MGSEYTLDALRLCGCSSVVSIGRLDGASGVQSIAGVDLLEDESIDICILEYLNPGSGMPEEVPLRRMQRIISRALKTDGVLLIGFASGLRRFVKKLFIETVLREAGCKTFHWYICVPSFLDPEIIYPYTRHESQTRKDLMPGCPAGSAAREFIKYMIKKSLVRSTVRYNPLWGTILIAYKQENGYQDRCASDMVEKKEAMAEGHRTDRYTVWFAKQDTGKQVGLVYRPGDEGKQLVSVCKSCSYPFGRSSSIQEENRVLCLLSAHSRFFQEKNIRIPEPLFFETDGTRSLSGESPVPGTSLSALKADLWNQGRMEEVIQRLYTIQLSLQQYLTRHMRDRMPALDTRYLENSTGVRHQYLDDSRRLEEYTKYVQHGDYTDVNLLYDRASRSWGIIDWEWTSSGYPPLFDIFYLTLSLGITMAADSHGDALQYRLQSFLDTFFDKNDFSMFVRDRLDWYCAESGTNREMTFDYFLDFLLFLYNKYKLAYALPEYEKKHGTMILYALNNRDRFSLQ